VAAVARDEAGTRGRKNGDAKAPRAKEREAPPTAPARKSTLREYFESIVIAVILALFVRTWVVQAFKIPTGSMENNLLVGDHLLVNKFVFGPTLADVERAALPISSIGRGDVVVFKYPEDPERDFIKRVIGLPGETLEVRSKVVHVDGRPLDEQYVHFLRPASGPGQELTGFDRRENYGPVRIPDGHYFVMGDNRDNSQDSRYWGFLPAHYVKGRALVVYWSFDPGPEGPYARQHEGAARVFSFVTEFFTSTRWGRILHQIR
jgi:signal peptidase I